MSLLIDVSACDQSEDIRSTDDTVEGLKSRAIGFATMAIGEFQITPKTIERFWVRLDAWQRVVGALLRDGEGQPVMLTIADVKRRMGLRTNAFPAKTDAQWAKTIMRAAQGDGEYAWRREHDPKYVTAE